MTEPVTVLETELGEFGEWLAGAGPLEELPRSPNTELPILPYPHFWGLGMKNLEGHPKGYYLSVTKSDVIPAEKFAEVYIGPYHPGFDEIRPLAYALLDELKEIAHG